MNNYFQNIMEMTETYKLYIETYGCQMNLNDTEIVSGIMREHGWETTDNIDNADAVLLNTCSVRENAESRIFKRLTHFSQKFKKRKNKLIVGVIGCMAERFNERLIDIQDIVSIVVGPDEYRKLPILLEHAMGGIKGVAVELSKVETYEDIIPLRTDGVNAWLSIMRGCNNFCSYCVVPYTRGRERSRSHTSILEEVASLAAKGFKEITLLGQNVNSYHDKELNKDFADLISDCAIAVPHVRIRYTTSHPRDMSDRLINVMASHDNICKHIHLPVQSGSDRVLKMMNRGYNREHYLGRISKIRELMPNIAITTDIIAGFPGETLEDHQLTLSLLQEVKYSGAFMFKYSPRENTKAFDMPDDIPEEEKLRRLNEIIDLQNKIAKEINHHEKGNIHRVLVESPSKRNPEDWMGRSDTNKVVIFPNPDAKFSQGDYVNVKIKRSSSATLFGEIVE